MSNEPLAEWLESGEYLPDFMRDFHAQKDIFKAMHNTITNANDNGNWRDGHIYVVDTFLWYMARCGYTLQKSRKQVPFRNMNDDISKDKEAAAKRFTQILGG
ncbi:hypothetical protein [Pectobacterium versatile]|uniref:hypothetical protein n=1 Tax=Pectobacterium versatile TaxID=2488639 RepID=UPI001F2CB3F1|nr:hypothetical protein [Pectobacterium versatile]